MSLNDSNNSNVCIDPSLLELGQEQFQYTGAWTGQVEGYPEGEEEGTLPPQSIDLGELPIAGVAEEWQEDMPTEVPSWSHGGTDQSPSVFVEAHFLQPANLLPSGLRPEAPIFVPQNLQRPHLHLSTSGPELLPVAPAGGSVAPLSAPAICVYEPDAMLPQDGINPQTTYRHPRRRANTGPRRTLKEHGRNSTAPASPGFSSDGHLSPDIERWLSTSHPIMLARPTNLLANTTGHASQPSTPSRSRSSSVASSTRSSASGAHLCNHSGCDKRYNTKAALNHHRRIHTPYHLRSHVCNLCSARFLFMKELRRHSVKHVERQFVCKECGSLFARKDHLDRHLGTQHQFSNAASPASSGITDMTDSVSRSAESSAPRQHDRTAWRDDTPMTACSYPPQFDLTSGPPQEVRDAAMIDMDRDPFVDCGTQPPSPSSGPRSRSNIR